MSAATIKTNIKSTVAIVAAAITSIVFFTAPMASAQINDSAISQGFIFDTSQGEAAPGAIVSAKTSADDSVELATEKTSSSIIGVVSSQSLIEISSSDQEVQVIVNGTANVLVSDINGPIDTGDKITISPIAGSGMAVSEDCQVIGTAQASFNTGDSETRDIKDSDGNAHTVHIGSVPVQIDIAYYQTPGSNYLPPFLQDLANGIAGRPVSLIRVTLTALIILFGLVYAAVLIYTSTRTSVISIGRNPLASRSIRKNLINTGLLTIAILVATLVAAYLVISI